MYEDAIEHCCRGQVSPGADGCDSNAPRQTVVCNLMKKKCVKFCV
jgi:hypothetical protein